MSVTISDDMQEWQREQIAQLLEMKNVSFRAASRILHILNDQPNAPAYFPNIMRVGKHCQEWTTVDGRANAEQPDVHKIRKAKKVKP